MKKLAIFAIAFAAAISPVFFMNGGKPPIDVKQIIKQSDTPIQGSKEELYQDLFLSLLEPYTEKAISDYYSNYLTDLPGSAPYFHNVLSVERVWKDNEPRRFEFLVKLEVLPYIGPHNSVGRDRITFRVQASGDVSLEKFEHLESFPIAPNYQSIIKKWPPS